MMFNRPERCNAFDQRMLDELARAVLRRGSRRRYAHRRAARRRQALLRRRRSLGARQRQSRMNRPRMPHCADVLIALDTALEADDRGGARRGGRRRRGVRRLLRYRDRHRGGVFLRSRRCASAWRRSASMPFLVRAMGDRSFRRYGLSGERILPRPKHCASGSCMRCVEADKLDDRLATHRRRAVARRARRAARTQDRVRTVRLAPLDAILAHRTPHDPTVAGGARRHRELPRKAQTELVSAMSSKGDAMIDTASFSLPGAAASRSIARTPPTARSTRPPRRKARWSGTRP